MARKDFELQKDVDIDDIYLDPENARIRSGSSQEECIAKVLKKSDQLIVLIKSIVKDGLSTTPILITPYSNEQGKWVVKDGNRRITALKLLNRPGLCPDVVLREKIIGIATSSTDIPAAVDCLSSSNTESILKEVISRHSGAQEGAGQLDWSAYLRTFYLLNNNQYSEYKRAGQYCLWAEQQGIFIDDEFPISTISRFLNTENLELIGFRIVNDELVEDLPKDKLVGMARKIITDFTNKNLNVDDVKKNEQAQQYLETVRKSVGLTAKIIVEIIDQPRDNDKATTLIDPKNNPVSTSPQESIPAAAVYLGQQVGNRKASWDRTKLFHPGSPKPSIPISHNKVRSVVAEITNLNVSKTPIAVGFLLRVLIDFSTKQFSTARSIKDQGGLAKNVLINAKAMANEGLIDAS